MKIAAIQLVDSANREQNVSRAIHWVRSAANAGAELILLPEMFMTVCFVYEESEDRFPLAEPLTSPTMTKICRLAREVQSILMIPFFERSTSGRFYNRIAGSTIMANSWGIIEKGIFHRVEIKDLGERFYFVPGAESHPFSKRRWPMSE